MAGLIAWAMPVSGQNMYPAGIDCKTASTEGKDETSNVNYFPYIPYQYQDNIPIRVNLVFLQDDEGDGNYQEKDPEQQRMWDEVEERVNYMFSHFSDSEDTACYAWKDPFLQDARIRVTFNRIYIADDKYWAWSEWGNIPESINPGLSQLKALIDANPDIPRAINIFFSENAGVYEIYLEAAQQGIYVEPLHEGYAYSGFPNTSEIPYIHFPDNFCKFLWMKYLYPHSPDALQRGWTWEDDIWYMQVNSLAAGIAHELGHSLNLNHWCPHYKTNECPHALMNQSYDSEHNRSYIPPTEIGRIHYTLSTSLDKEVVPEDLLPVHDWLIEEPLDWSSPYFRCYGNIQVNLSGQLHAAGDVYMPRTSPLDVEGQLYIRNGDVECVMEDGAWNGIRVKSGGVLWLENTAISDYDIVLEPGSTLVLKGNVTVDNGHKIAIGNGCYVCAASDFQILGSAKPFVRDGSPYSGIKPGTSLLYSSPCSSTGWNKFIAASSTLSDVLYVQNQQIGTNQTLVAEKIIVGSNVTSSKPSGQVTIEGGAHVNFISLDGTRFEKGFRCENGSTFTVTEMEE